MNQSDNIYGVNMRSSDAQKGLQAGEMVDIMFLDYTIADLKKFSESEAERERECEKLGMIYEPREPTFKEQGICWKYAIIKRSRGETDPRNFEKVFYPDDNYKPIEPPFICFGQINELPPDVILKKKIRAQRFAGGITINQKTKNPVIIEMHPNPYVEKDWKDNVRADEVKDNNKYSYLLKRERERLDKWDSILRNYRKLNDDEAFNVLQSGISRRMLNCAIGENVYEYFPIQKGTVCRCKLEKRDKFLDVKAFEMKRGGGVEIYSTLSGHLPTEEFVESAKDLIFCREDNKRKRLENKEKGE